MTREQEEAIEYLEQFIGKEKEYKHKPIKIKILPNTRNAIETVLNMLKEKDKEIEKLKEENKNIMKLNANMSKRHLDDIFKIKRKDKIIDLMAIFMANLDIDGEICKYQVSAFCDNEQKGVTLDVCAECIKQYFERRSEV